MDSIQYENTIINMAVESWRLSRLFIKAVSKLDPSETNKYIGQLRYFQKNIESSLEDCNLKIVNIEGQSYDVGMAAVAMNIEDFNENDVLLIESMIEPIIMGEDGIKRQGIVMVKKVEK